MAKIIHWGFFAVQRNIISESSREILNDNFADSDGSCRIKNVTERLKFGEMQVDDILVTFKAVFSVFSMRTGGRRISTIFRLSIMHVFCWVL